jgi:hypothetical protein
LPVAASSSFPEFPSQVRANFAHSGASALREELFVLLERGCDAPIDPSIPAIPVPAANFDLMGLPHLAFCCASTFGLAFNRFFALTGLAAPFKKRICRLSVPLRLAFGELASPLGKFRIGVLHGRILCVDGHWGARQLSEYISLL